MTEQPARLTGIQGVAGGFPNDSAQSAPVCEEDVRADAEDLPIGDAGDVADRDPATGRFLPGNKLAVVAGMHSIRFWRECHAAREAIVDAALRDKGFTRGDAPEALQRAADGLAMAVLIRDSAWLRVTEEGGPLSSASRPRRAFQVWEKATAAVERHVKLLGIERAEVKRVDLARRLSGLDRS